LGEGRAKELIQSTHHPEFSSATQYEYFSAFPIHPVQFLFDFSQQQIHYLNNQSMPRWLCHQQASKFIFTGIGLQVAKQE
jgi:hypothetical protein